MIQNGPGISHSNLTGVRVLESNLLEKKIIDRILTEINHEGRKEYPGEYLLNIMRVKNITREYFTHPLYQNIYDRLQDIIWSEKIIPSYLKIMWEFPDYIFEGCNFWVNDYIDELCRRYKHNKIQTKVQKLFERLSKSIDIPKDLVHDLYKTALEGEKDLKETYFLSHMDKFLEEKVQNKGSLAEASMKTWIYYIDNTFWWIRPTDYIWILADEKRWKSWVMCYLANKLSQSGKNVLFVSPEMDSNEVEERLHMLNNGQDNNNFDALNFSDWNLTENDFLRWKETNKKRRSLLEQHKGWEIVIIDDIPLADFNITTIKNRLENVDTKLKVFYSKKFPNNRELYENRNHLIDCIIIDWYHLLNWTDIRSKASEWKENQLISQGLRSFARIEKVPLIVALHTNRDSQNKDDKLIPDQRDTAMSASLWRDLTLLISLFSTPKYLKDKKLGMAAKLSRRSSLEKNIWTMHFDPTKWELYPHHSWPEQTTSEEDLLDSISRESLS